MRFFNISLLTLATSLCLFGFLNSANAGTIVTNNKVPSGTILIETKKRRLYLGIGRGKAISYPVGVGKSGRQWKGSKRIYSKRIKPAWVPTKDILRATGRKTGKVIPGGSSKNPMGAAALVLSGGGQYAIHGTNNPGSIGGFVSFGCIRMHNKDVMDLYRKVHIGTKVIVR